MAEKIKLTKAGRKKLEDEYRNLVDVVREEVKVQLAEARAQGDLKENADYDAARGRQAEVEARIKQIEDILANSEEIKGSVNKNKVSLGSTITIKFLDSSKVDTYMIVGTVESDGFAHKISNASPLGEAVIGKSVGDIVEIKSVRNYKIEIQKIEIK